MGNQTSRLSLDEEHAPRVLEFEQDNDVIELLDLSACSQMAKNDAKVSCSNHAMDRMTLQDLIASGAPMPLSALPHGSYRGAANDETFIRRTVMATFRVKQSLPSVRVIIVLEEEDVLMVNEYHAIEMGDSLSKDLLSKGNVRVISMGSINAYGSSDGSMTHVADDGQSQSVKWDMYVPEHPQVVGSVLQVYVCSTEGNSAILIVDDEGGGQGSHDDYLRARSVSRLAYFDEMIAEQRGKISNLLKSCQPDTTFSAFEFETLVDVIHRSRSIARPPTHHVTSTDGCLLALTTFEPVNVSSVMVTLLLLVTDRTLMEYFASLMTQRNAIRVVLADLRGFGYSSGRRGDAPSTHQIFEDVNALVEDVKCRYPQCMTVLGGFMASAGVAVNYCRKLKTDGNLTKVDAMILMTPIMGLEWIKCCGNANAKRMRHGGTVHRKGFSLMMARLTRGLIGGHKYVIRFSSNADLYRLCPTYVNRITSNYLRAMMVPYGHAILSSNASHSIPSAVFMGALDEYYDVDRLADAMRAKVSRIALDDRVNMGNRSRLFLFEEKSTLQVIHEQSNRIAEWMLNVANPDSGIRKTMGISPLDSLAHLEGVMGAQLLASYKLAILEDGNLHHCSPSTLPARPVASMVILAASCFASHLGRLARQGRFQIVRVDPYDLMQNSERLYQRIADHLRIFRADYPDSPAFVAGIGMGVEVCLQYQQLCRRGSVDLNRRRYPSGSGLLLFVGPNGKTNSLYERLYYERPSQRIVDATFDAEDLLTMQRLHHLVGRHAYDRVQHLKWNEMMRLMVAVDIPCAIHFVEPLPDRQSLRKLAQSLPAPHSTILNSIDMERGSVEEDWFYLKNAVFDAAGEWMHSLADVMAPGMAVPALSGALTIEDFQPMDLIGRGAFGHVWLVRHVSSQRLYALKMIEKRLLTSSSLRRQMERERRLLEECRSCPFVVNYSGAFQDEQRAYIVMEFLIGGELFTRMSMKSHPLTEEDVLFYASEVLVALRYMNQRGLVYRDLKPENIVLDSLGHVRLVDFGFAKSFRASSSNHHQNGHLELTQCRSFCGSPYYIAPEMLANCAYDYSVDLWAFGVLLYEMAVGRPPFSGSNPKQVYAMIRNAPSRMKVSSSDVKNRDLCDLIQQLLVANPEERLGYVRADDEVMDPFGRVMEHAYFGGVDWDRVRDRHLAPAYVPHYTFAGDTRNFVKYPNVPRFYPSSMHGVDEHGSKGVDSVSKPFDLYGF